MLRVRRKSIRDASSMAHLWPPGLIGRKICRVKELIK